MKKFNLVIPAAGAATRLRPLSSNTSKVMVRVNGKPCLDYIVESVNAWCEEIVVVDGQFSDIRDYCSIKHPSIKCVKQPELKGPRDAIAIGINELTDPELPLVVWLGDAIILEKDLPFGTDFLLTKEVKDQSSWCMWDGVDYYNKPQQPIKGASALVGLYSFSRGYTAEFAFNHTTDYDISSALKLYLKNRTVNEPHDYVAKFDNISTDKWYDIGDLPTYYKTCAELLNLKARAFNRLEFNSDLGTIRKTPDYHDQHSIDTIQNEKNWYDNLTPEQSMFTPRILPHETDLIMSYESGTLLSDLMLYENLPPSAWEYIIDKVFKLKLNYFNDSINDMSIVSEFSELSYEMWVEKSKERLSQTDFKTNEIFEYAKEIHKHTRPVDVHHGDLHFGNILYNQATDQFKLIDPRGQYGTHVGTLGDNIYDWAKLAHDLYFGYSSIVADVPQNMEVKDIFINKLKEYNLPVDIILKGGLLLLATCIPLHYDNRQRQLRMKEVVWNNLNK
jgi:glucose-1-phosphate thymidylyltransferase